MENISPLFEVQRLNKAGLTTADMIAHAFNELLIDIRAMVFAGQDVQGAVEAASREFSLVKTHLEIASFYAKKAMAKNPGFQEKL